MPTELTAVYTPGSMARTEAPMLMTVEEEWFRVPANIDGTNSIRSAAQAMPTKRPVNLALSLTRSL